MGHELERLTDPEAAKYATAAAAVTTSGNADLHTQVTEHESQQHTRASEELVTVSSIDWWSISSSFLLPVLLAAVWFSVGRCIAISESLDRIGSRLDLSCKKLDAAKEGRQ